MPLEERFKLDQPVLPAPTFDGASLYISKYGIPKSRYVLASIGVVGTSRPVMSSNLAALMICILRSFALAMSYILGS